MIFQTFWCYWRNRNVGIPFLLVNYGTSAVIPLQICSTSTASPCDDSNIPKLIRGKWSRLDQVIAISLSNSLSLFLSVSISVVSLCLSVCMCTRLPVWSVYIAAHIPTNQPTNQPPSLIDHSFISRILYGCQLRIIGLWFNTFPAGSIDSTILSYWFDLACIAAPFML